MKLYGEFTKHDWLQAFRIDEKDVPSAMIVHGAYHNCLKIIGGKKFLAAYAHLITKKTLIKTFLFR
ncbi:Purine nucleoside phosphorylase [Parageobacillus toebii]|uniref:Purine nucleoside phosphorylase n=1 Tax=Parageobacillus toebii TaxID=153151 RepID=A0A150MNQ4_9BACL|nr:Purine nucleoside phosphorylase [Parageobacillus toebii]